MSEDEQRRILQLLAIEKEQRRSHESLKKWATENFAILGHWKRAAEIKERAAENFSVLKSAPAKACSKKCTVGSKVKRNIARPAVGIRNAKHAAEYRARGITWHSVQYRAWTCQILQIMRALAWTPQKCERLHISEHCELFSFDLPLHVHEIKRVCLNFKDAPKHAQAPLSDLHLFSTKHLYIPLISL